MSFRNHKHNASIMFSLTYGNTYYGFAYRLFFVFNSAFTEIATNTDSVSRLEPPAVLLDFQVATESPYFHSDFKCCS